MNTESVTNPQEAGQHTYHSDVLKLSAGLRMGLAGVGVLIAFGALALFWNMGLGEPIVIRIGTLVAGAGFVLVVLRVIRALLLSTGSSLALDDQSVALQGHPKAFNLGWGEIGRAKLLETKVIGNDEASSWTRLSLILYGKTTPETVLGRVDGLENYKGSEDAPKTDEIVELVERRLGEPVVRESETRFAPNKKGPEWTCPECGTLNTDYFTNKCSQCGAPKPRPL